MKLRRDELPLHFEGLGLRPWIVVAGWPVALVTAVVSVVLVGTSSRAVVDAIGLVVGVLAALLIAGLARCRRYETVVGASLLTAGAGPFRRRVPVGALGQPELRPAGSWRRLYADRELVFDLPAHGDTIVLPTGDPEALRAALREARSAPRPGASG